MPHNVKQPIKFKYISFNKFSYFTTTTYRVLESQVAWFIKGENAGKDTGIKLSEKPLRLMSHKKNNRKNTNLLQSLLIQNNLQVWVFVLTSTHVSTDRQMPFLSTCTDFRADQSRVGNRNLQCSVCSGRAYTLYNIMCRSIGHRWPLETMTNKK